MYRGVFHAMSVILKNEGLKGLLRGLNCAVSSPPTCQTTVCSIASSDRNAENPALSSTSTRSSSMALAWASMSQSEHTQTPSISPAPCRTPQIQLPPHYSHYPSTYSPVPAPVSLAPCSAPLSSLSRQDFSHTLHSSPWEPNINTPMLGTV